MTHDQFALLLDKVAAQLGEEIRQSNKYHSPCSRKEGRRCGADCISTPGGYVHAPVHANEFIQ
jgi:hypothetical protein